MSGKFTDDDMAPEPQGPTSTRLWLSDQQWMALLERARRSTPESHPRHDPSKDPDRRGERRISTSCRCVLRFGGDTAGTYSVRTVNISSTGLGFVHVAPVPKGTRCTLALQVEEHNGMILAGRVAWCRKLETEDGVTVFDDEPAFEVGLQFDKPIDLEPLGHVA